MAIPLPPRISRHHNPHKLGLHGLEISRYFASETKPVMKQYKIIPLILTFLTAGNVSAADLDTLKVVDVEEVLVIAAPKENRKLREQPTAVTLLSQQDMQKKQGELLEPIIVKAQDAQDHGAFGEVQFPFVAGFHDGLLDRVARAASEQVANPIPQTFVRTSVQAYLLR